MINTNNKLKKIIIAIVAAILIIVSFLVICLFGNPVSKILANNNAEKYIKQEYSNTDYYIEDITYSFKDGYYYVNILSPSSIDTTFSLCYNWTGKLQYNTYDNVLSKLTTVYRLDEEYRKFTNQVFESDKFSYESDINFGTLEIHPAGQINNLDKFEIPDYAIEQESLILDKQYDIYDLGKQAGHIVVYIECSEVNFEKAAYILLNLKSIFDKANVSFAAIDLVLQYPLIEDETRGDEEIHIAHFLYEDIYEDDLVTRIKSADAELKAYYKNLEKE